MLGSNNGGGIGVAATASTGGTALQVNGPDTFSRSGTAVIAGTVQAPRSSVLVQGVALSPPDSIVIATLRSHIDGVGIAGATVMNATDFTVYLTQPATSNVKVGWFIIN